jgi:hypothetical protein
VASRDHFGRAIEHRVARAGVRIGGSRRDHLARAAGDHLGRARSDHFGRATTRTRERRARRRTVAFAPECPPSRAREAPRAKAAARELDRLAPIQCPRSLSRLSRSLSPRRTGESLRALDAWHGSASNASLQLRGAKRQAAKRPVVSWKQWLGGSRDHRDRSVNGGTGRLCRSW